MVEIVLTQGKVALIDSEDFERVSRFKWSAMRRDHCWYAYHWVSVGGGKGTTQYLHQFLTGRLNTDHIDGNGLNNRRSNLRAASTQLNNCNKHKTWAKSGFKGVAGSKNGQRWEGRIRFNKKLIFLGSYETPQEAAQAYDEAALRYFGEFAFTNKDLGLLT